MGARMPSFRREPNRPVETFKHEVLLRQWRKRRSRISSSIDLPPPRLPKAFQARYYCPEARRIPVLIWSPRRIAAAARSSRRAKWHGRELRHALAKARPRTEAELFLGQLRRCENVAHVTEAEVSRQRGLGPVHRPGELRRHLADCVRCSRGDIERPAHSRRGAEREEFARATARTWTKSRCCAP